MKSGREQRALRSTLVVSAFGYAAQALSLIAIPLFLATLGASGYGLMVTVMAFMGYLCFADAGLSWGSMILIAQAEGRGERAEIAHIVRHSVILAIGSGVVVGLALGLILVASSAGWRLPMFSGQPEADRLVLIAGVQLGLTLQFSVFYNLFHGLQEGYWTGFYQGLARLLGLLGGMSAAWLTRSVEVVMLVQLVTTVGCGVAAAIHVRQRHRWAFAAGSWTDGAQYRTQLRIGAKNFLLQIGRTLSGTAPTLGISSILGPAAVPFYTVPTTLLSLFFVPINSWNANLQTAYGEAWMSGARDWVRTAFRHSLERAMIVGGLGVALFLALGATFIRLWTHDRLWVDPATAFSVAAIVAMSAWLTAGQFLLAGLNRHRQAALAEIANGLLALALVIAAVSWFGLGAVGGGVVIAAIATSVWVLRREIAAQLGDGCFPDWRFCLKVCLAMVAAALVALLIDRTGVNSDVRVVAARLVVSATVGAAVFFAAVFVLKLVATADVVALGRRLKLRFIPFSPWPSQ
jgi:O-antigen/teichoic acid export membrane protein